MDLTQAQKIVAEAVKNNGTELNLRSNYDEEKLFDSGLIKLLPDILKLESLTSLYLNNNQISDASFLSELKSLSGLEPVNKFV